MKHIEMPALSSATDLTPLEMNAIRFDPKHTVLTPDLLERAARAKQAAAPAQ